MIRPRNTYQSGANRMLFDHAWHSSTPLDKLAIGDVLRIKNKDSGEVVDWKVTELPTHLNPDEARAMWLRYPFGDASWAAKYGYFPCVIRNLEKIQEIPPQKPSPRYIPSEVRIAVWDRDGGRCKRCGAQEDLEFDHVIPVAKGGNSTERNIELLCRSCNRQKSDIIS